MNPIQNCPGLLCAVLMAQPFVWVFIVLAIVAAFVAVTERYDIGRDSAGAIWIVQWYPMIHSHGVKESRRATTNGATAVEVVKGKLPVVFVEIISKSAPSCPIAMAYSAKFSSVLFGVFAAGLPPSFRVPSPPLSVSTGVIRVVSFSNALPLSLFFDVTIAPFIANLSTPLSVIDIPLTAVFGLFFKVPGSLDRFAMACSTSPTKAWRIVTVVTIKILSRCREFIAANYTALKGYVILFLHVERPFDLPYPRLLVQRWDNLLTPLIIPQNGGAV